MKKLFDFKSLTVVSSLLGLVLLLIDSLGNYEGTPKNIIAISEVIAFLLTFFGLFNAAKASEQNMIDKFREFATSKFGGSVLVGLLTYLSQRIPDDPTAPDDYVVGAKIIGAILTVLLGAPGARELFIKARLDDSPVAPKYMAYAEKK